MFYAVEHIERMENRCEHILKQAAQAREEGRLADAQKAYLEILRAKPDSGSVLNALGTVFWDQSQPDKAKKYFEAANFLLQSLGTSTTPDAAPAEHVRRIFDQCAGTFEKTLANDLEYKTPERLFSLVRPHLKQDLAVLDLGCGTGLGSQFYRPYAKLLIGVDVSSKMLQKASEKNIYDDPNVYLTTGQSISTGAGPSKMTPNMHYPVMMTRCGLRSQSPARGIFWESKMLQRPGTDFTSTYRRLSRRNTPNSIALCKRPKNSWWKKKKWSMKLNWPPMFNAVCCRSTFPRMSNSVSMRISNPPEWSAEIFMT
ncbi:MAG: methyltransferase domain-containing protein [Desulfobacterales bacterium]|nr:methyltransferase domain-containing protein [Desulfobacterales bacterium]